MMQETQRGGNMQRQGLKIVKKHGLATPYDWLVATTLKRWDHEQERSSKVATTNVCSKETSPILKLA